MREKIYPAHSEAVPADLAMCNRCRKVAGSYKGWYGAECRCDRPTGNAWDGAHTAGGGARNGALKPRGAYDVSDIVGQRREGPQKK